MSFGSVLRRGALAGAAAGVAAALVQWLLVEPVLRRAIAIEKARAGSPAAGTADEPLVTRSMQVVGGVLTTVVVGVLLGLVFAVVLAATRRRLPGSGEFARAVTLAAIGFGVFALLPAITYPSYPPGVGDPATVGQRSLLYGSVLLAGVLITLAVFGARAMLIRRGWAGPPRAAAVFALGVLLVAVVLAVWPAGPDQIPSAVPAGLIWDFRARSLAQHAALWSVLGVVTGLLLDRAVPARGHAASSREPARS